MDNFQTSTYPKEKYWREWKKQLRRQRGKMARKLYREAVFDGEVYEVGQGSLLGVDDCGGHGWGECDR